MIDMDWNDEDIGYKVANRVWGCGFSIIIVIIICLACSVCCSCTTNRTVTEYEYIHDTVRIEHSDTVREIKIETKTITDTVLNHVRDTIFRDRGQVIVVNEKGDTIKQREWDNLMEKIHELTNAIHTESHNNSDSLLRHENDSLRQALQHEHGKETVKVVRKPNWWGYAFVAAFAFVIALWFLRWTKK